MRIYVDENIPKGTELFSPYGDVTLFSGRALTNRDLAQTKALVVRSVTQVNARLLEGTPVEFVGTSTIGTDHIDQAYLQKRNIGFAFAPGCNSNSVGEYLVSALLRISQKQHYSLQGKTLGIVGYGNVGKNVKQKAEALGMRTLLCDPPLQELQQQGDSQLKNISFSSIEKLQREADALTFHVPLTKEGPYPTYRMVNSNFIQKLQKKPLLFNTCRGDVFEEEALVSGLRNQLISHLVLDVFPNEPHLNTKLCSLCEWITPHVAGYSLEGKTNGGQAVLEALCQHFHFPRPIFTQEEEPIPIQPLFPPSLSHSSQTEGDRELQALASCVYQTYDIAKDDMALRKALKTDNIPNAFDQLRKNYPIRREFPHHLVSLSEKKQGLLRQKLESIGFLIRS
jgi:erythronate-4-phosphate dehydrogenase